MPATATAPSTAPGSSCAERASTPGSREAGEAAASGSSARPARAPGASGARATSVVDESTLDAPDLRLDSLAPALRARGAPPLRGRLVEEVGHRAGGAGDDDHRPD